MEKGKFDFTIQCYEAPRAESVVVFNEGLLCGSGDSGSLGGGHVGDGALPGTPDYVYDETPGTWGGGNP